MPYDQPIRAPQPFTTESAEIFIDGGREFNHGQPPDTILFNGAKVSNPRKHASPQSMLGVTQKAWFLDKAGRWLIGWSIG